VNVTTTARFPGSDARSNEWLGVAVADDRRDVVRRHTDLPHRRRDLGRASDAEVGGALSPPGTEAVWPPTVILVVASSVPTHPVGAVSVAVLSIGVGWSGTNSAGKGKGAAAGRTLLRRTDLVVWVGHRDRRDRPPSDSRSGVFCVPATE
jgi:hypothetical protein